MPAVFRVRRYRCYFVSYFVSFHFVSPMAPDGNARVPATRCLRSGREGQFTRFSRPTQNGARSSVFSTFPAPDSGSGMSRTSTLRGHL
jgi:hypothetical protein